LHNLTRQIQQLPDSATVRQKLSIQFPNKLIAPEAEMPRSVEVKEGQRFQDGTGLTVRVGEVDANDRVHFSVFEDREGTRAELGEMSYFAFVNRFTRIDSVKEACARIKHLGYVTSRRVRLYGEEFELLSDPFPDADRITICAKAKGDSSVRILRLPVTIVQSGRGWQPVKAA
jgi:hypothetical protein